LRVESKRVESKRVLYVLLKNKAYKTFFCIHSSKFNVPVVTVFCECYILRFIHLLFRPLVKISFVCDFVLYVTFVYIVKVSHFYRFTITLLTVIYTKIVTL